MTEQILKIVGGGIQTPVGACSGIASIKHKIKPRQVSGLFYYYASDLIDLSADPLNRF